MPQRSGAPRVLTQFSVIDALVVGLFGGEFTVAEAAHAGDLGVGCGDHASGELVVLDGVFHLFGGDGSATVLPADATLPFAEMARLSPDAPSAEVSCASEEELLAEVRRLAPSENLFRGLRLDGRFGRVDLRTPLRQERPFLSLAETVGDQRERTVTDVDGTLVGFTAPHFLQGVSVAGPHLHFVDRAGEIGGHVLGLGDIVGTLTVDTFTEFSLRFPDSAEYRDADLAAAEADADAVIRHAESEHSGTGGAGRP